MGYRFNLTLDEQLAYFAQSMRGSRLGGFDGGTYFFEAMFALVAIEAALARDRDVDATARIRRDVAASLAPYGKQVSAYAQVVADEVDTGARETLAEHCARRSSLQYLLDEYGDGPVAASIAPADVARFDEDLRRIVSEEEALPAIEVPLGIPSSHWWWYPPYVPRDRAS